MIEKSIQFDRKLHAILVNCSQGLEQNKNIEDTAIELCIEHSQPIDYLCFSCSNFLLCAQCIALSNHQHHDLRNLQKGRQFIRHELQEWNSRLQLKSEILDNLNEQLKNTHAEIYEQIQSYKQKVVSKFEQIIKIAKQQLQTVLKSINEFSNESKKNYTDTINQIISKRMEIRTIIEENQNKVNQKSVQLLAQYFHNKVSSLNLQLLGKQIKYYKQFLNKPLCGIEPQLFENVTDSIHNLQITFKCQTTAPSKEEVEFERENLLRSVKKLKKEFKLNEVYKIDRNTKKGRNSNVNSFNSFLVGCTPKNLSKEKKISGQKSPGQKNLLKKKKKSVSKIVSLSSSPSKELKDFQNETKTSTRLSHKNLFKKK